jgi:predicted deacylase
LDLATVQFGAAGRGPHVLIVAGVHGDEFEPMAAVRRLASELERRGERAIEGRVTLVPVVNEAAFAAAERTAGDGLDLARTCPGRPDGSITEQTADALARLIRTADYLVDLHTGGLRLQVYPLAGYMLVPDRAVLERQRRMARAFGLPIVWGTDPSLEGRSLSVARDAGVPAIYAEFLGGSGGLDPRGVRAYVRGCLAVLAELGLLDGGPSRSDSRPAPIIVEDPRSNSGYLQIQHPSPCPGFFEPAVRPGQPVRQGDLLGTVSDPIGRTPVPIAADRAGVVLVLRALPSVAPGDSLAVVLETDQVPPDLADWQLS